jgi:uncharacterized membrane protein YfcA
VIEVLGLLAMGVAAGTLSGLLGIGGATIMIPALLLIFKTTQHMAQGTSIAALLLPVGALALVKYYQAGNVNWKFALLIAVGFLIGGLIGGTFAQSMSELWLKKAFGLYMLVIAIQMLFFN